jgi:hypothetical protein
MWIATFVHLTSDPTPLKIATLGPDKYNVGAQVAVRGSQ